jgi:hypothetical protein
MHGVVKLALSQVFGYTIAGMFDSLRAPDG